MTTRDGPHHAVQTKLATHNMWRWATPCDNLALAKVIDDRARKNVK
jgi:hypothetical protein